MEKQSLIVAFQEWIAFIRKLEHCNERIWNQVIAEGKWSVREIVAHIALWDQYFYEEGIEKLASGQSLTVRHLDFDTFNANASIYGLNTPIATLSSLAIYYRARIIGLIESLSDKQYETTYRDADDHPFLLPQYMIDFTEHDHHHMAQIASLLDSDTIGTPVNVKNKHHLNLEEISLNAWPALQTVLHDGWLMRFADGYTKRSNCIVPLYDISSDPDDLLHKINYCEQLYTSQQLDTVFKILSFGMPQQLDQMLDAHGYIIVDPVFMKTVALSSVKEPAREMACRKHDQVSDAWMDDYSSMIEMSDQQRELAIRLLSSMPLQKCFVTLYDEDRPVACGIGILERGYIGLFDIVTAPGYRNRGIGEQLVLQLLQWGKQHGAETGYLLVVQDNAPANRMYDKIGFKEQYQYWYRVKSRKV
ncbi:MAG: GNAT family N-acetyltransferase [Candidatus Pristimantibacillus sp.]